MGILAWANDARPSPCTSERNMNRVQLLRIASVGTLAILASSCIITSNAHTSRSGKYVSAETLAHVEPGKSQEYVIAVLGDPTSKTSLSDGTEIWRWTWRERKTSSGAVLFVIDADKSSENEHSTYVEFRDGVVSKSWQD